jgi:hypothetical protein
MGSSAFEPRTLPIEIRKRIGEAVGSGMTIIVREASEACKLYQRGKGVSRNSRESARDG